MRSVQSFSSSRKWVGLFGLWLLFLSGSIANYVGSPGILQAIKLQELLDTKKTRLSQIQDELNRLQTETTQLENSRFAQEREVRRVLGYAASDEIIFDFSSSDTH